MFYSVELQEGLTIILSIIDDYDKVSKIDKLPIDTSNPGELHLLQVICFKL